MRGLRDIVQVVLPIGRKLDVLDRERVEVRFWGDDGQVGFAQTYRQQQRLVAVGAQPFRRCDDRSVIGEIGFGSVDRTELKRRDHPRSVRRG